MIQRSLVLIKPDGVKRNLIGEIIRRFEEAGLKVEELKKIVPDFETINKHYPLDNRNYILGLGHVDITGLTSEEIEIVYNKNHKIIERLHKYMTSGPIVKMVLSGEDAVSSIRTIVGKTDPAKSPKGSLRGDLGVDSFRASDPEDRACENLVHASGTPEEAEQEIILWFPNL